ncbi:fructosamine kinase family protein [Sulfurimicrobium lacus]|uniref:Fructosamine kinase family protein n=1 Tax=Sulfurimicrobium lacus TaxID=2715678 RepID=A0A6F8VBX4_9PROT|nr:fructosamine kinase family protein [Sulfurimicrobium lacus]BCB27164.1 fructosamine kinase family protein [Sulfurimicrobium lacus]
MTATRSQEEDCWSAIAHHISETRAEPFQAIERHAIDGGCINSAWRIEGCGQRYFVKLNNPHQVSMFEAEADGLRDLARHGDLRVPTPICWGATDQHAYLVLEHMDLFSPASASWEALGTGLAAQHRHTLPRFGWQRDNTIGATPQTNGWQDDWLGFWRERRLGFQLELAHGNGYLGALQDKGNALMESLDKFFPGHLPAASLLHGDLWNGNCAADQYGNPVIFDPSVYYGDRECDLAMTELFGAFPPRFYAAYREVYPLDPGYSVRKTLYNLYHILNHANLFGGGYAAQAERMMERLLSEIK